MNDNQKLFQTVKVLVIEWMKESLSYFNRRNIEVTVVRNEKNGIVVSFEKNTVMAELVVAQPSYAPFRFVSFEIVAIRDDQAQIVFSWYDNAYTSGAAIVEGLQHGIEILSSLGC